MDTVNMQTEKSPTAVICLSHHIGGMELAATKLAKVLGQRIDIHYIIREGSFIHEECRNNPDYKDIKHYPISFYKSISPAIIRNVRRIVKEKRIRNVIFVGASEMKSLYFAFRGLDINLTVRHGTLKSRPKKDWLHRLVYSNVGTHVAISKYMAKNVREIIPFGKNTDLKVIVPSLANKLCTKPREPSDKLRILHVGRVTPGKGIDRAIRACGILHENSIDFIFNSFGPANPKYEQGLKTLLDEVPYANKININGFTDSIYEKYREHDVFLFPTPDEGYGNVMMESISHGIAVLAFDNTAISNFGEMGFHIHLVEDASMSALKERLLAVATNRETEIRLAEENIEKAKTVFSPQREAQQYIDLLK